MRNCFLIWTVLVAGLLALWAGVAAQAQDPPPAQNVPAGQYRGDNIWYMGTATAVKADVSPPLRDMIPLQASGKAENEERDSDLMGPCGPLEPFDPVAQTCVGKFGEAPFAMPAPNVSFDGFTTLCGCSPPDPNGAVGPNHFLAMANSHFAVYSKTGTKLWPTGATTAAAINTVWTGFGGHCETENAGDPVVLYDHLADRWLITQFTAAAAPYLNCVALSTTGDPTGTWQRYAFPTPIATGANFPDYPKYGIWPDAYYIATREFLNGGSTFAGVGAYALDRVSMLAGNLSPNTVSFLAAPGSTAYYVGDGLLPADLDGSTLPPNGSPEYYLGTMDNGGPYSAPSDAINLFKFHVDWVTPANSTFTRTNTIAVAAFDSTFTPCGGGRTCIPQPGTTNTVDILSYRQRPLHRAAYRNFGDHESIVTNQSVAGTATMAGIRWYELRDPNGTPTIYQQGTYVPGATDSIHRWMASIAMDRMGNMGLGFSASAAATTYPSVWYTGRMAGDPLGTMPQGEGSIVNGTASQTSSNRWGDYSAITVDPTDDCTFWYINQYFSVADTWKLRIGSFTYPSCLCAVTPNAPLATGATASAPNQITVNWNDSTTASITQYFVLRATVSGGPYSQIATVPDSSPGVGGSGTYSYNDTPVSGGTRYYYVIKANDGASCTSANSTEVNALATGPCLLAPTFAGVASVNNPNSATCTLNLSWSAAASNCGGAITYNVYRSTSTGFTPGPSNIIATGISATSYQDIDNLVNGTPYYYVVRAVDSSNSSEETNTAEKNGTPSGPLSLGTYFAGAEAGNPTLTLNAPWAISAVYKRTGNSSYSTNATSTTYATSACGGLTTAPLVLGTSSILTFYHIYSTETGYDGGRVEISTNGGSTWTVLTPTPAYPATLTSASNACAWASGTSCYVGTSASYPTTWQLATINLGPTYDSQTVLLRWNFTSDGSVSGSGTNPGWYVDDINITNVMVPGTCATGSSCANNPSNVSVTPDGPLTLCTGTGQLLTASPTGGTGLTYQWYMDGSPIGGATSSTYTANDTGTHAYNCQVKGGGCTSAMSDGTSTSITWQAAPTFAGLSSVVNPQNATCTLSLSWGAGSSPCGTMTYNVYRSTTSGFTPGPANRVAAGVASTTFNDATGLVSGTTYYYVVRGQAGGTEETNLTQRNGVPTGTITTTTPFTENFDSVTAPALPSGWATAQVSGTAGAWATSAGTVHPSGGGTHSGTNVAYFNSFTSASGSATRLYRNTAGFSLAGATGASLSFWMYHDTGYSADNDNVQAQISTDSGSTWTNYGAAVPRYGASAGWTQHAVDLAGAIGQADVRIAFVGTSVYGNDCHIDDVSVTKQVAVSCTTGSTASPRVPYSVTPTKITTANHGTDGALNFDVANCPSTNYHVIYGKGENLSTWTVDGGQCAIGTSGSYSWSAVPDPASYTSRFLWFLIVGDNGSSTEGSWGLTSAATERGGSNASNQCSCATKDTSAACGTP